MPEVLALDVLIVGGGPAGLTAAVYARRAGLSVTLLEKEPMPGGQMATTPEIGNMPGILSIDGFTLSGQMAGQAKNLGAEIVTRAATALRLEPGNLRVETEGGVYAPKAVILAMGARRRRLGIPGEDRLAGRGVSWCAVCDGHFFKGKPVAVVGGGNTALEDALHLASLGCEVTLLHRRDAFRGSPSLAESVRKEPRILVKTPVRPLSVEGETSVTGLLLSHAETGETLTLPVSAVFVCAGTVANAELAAPWLSLNPEGRVKAGEDTETGIPGVYAAGDIREKPLYQIVTAAADGAVAAIRTAGFIERISENSPAEQ
jgi:thioredoxin reductase (NADPH)